MFKKIQYICLIHWAQDKVLPSIVTVLPPVIIPGIDCIMSWQFQPGVNKSAQIFTEIV